MRLLSPLVLFVAGTLASPVWRVHTTSQPSTTLDWITKWFSGETAARQGDDPNANWLWGWGWTWSESVITVMDNSTTTFSSRPAAFGLRIVNAPGLSGHLIPTSQLLPHCPTAAYSCPKICPHYPFPRLENEGWIALVQRGECSFVEKVREAQRLGAVGVVVGGREKGRDDDLITMYSPGDATDIGIPSCYVTYESYRGLMNLWEKSNDTTPSGYKALDLLLGEDEAWQWPVFTFSLLLLLPSILTLLTLVVHRIRQQRAEVRERAPEDIVSNLPTRVWNGTHWDKDETSHDIETGEATPTVEIGKHKMHWAWFETQVECAICLSAFERGDRVRVLPCGHVFHIEEIDGWLVKQKKLCPICKTDVTQPPVTPPTSPSIRAFPRAVHRTDTPTEHTPLLAVPVSRGPPAAPFAALPPILPAPLPPAAVSQSSSPSPNLTRATASEPTTSAQPDTSGT